MQILDGRAVRDFHKAKLADRIRVLPFSPVLALIQVGDVRESAIYIKRKIALAESIGAKVIHVKFPESVEKGDVIRAIEEKNADPSVHGIIIQLPLPGHLDKGELIDLIDPKKDVDGLTAESQDLLAAGRPRMIPATAKAVSAILSFYHIPVRGKKVAVLGKSRLVGSPTAKLLALQGASVSVCDSKTPDTREVAKASDIVVVAIGKPELVDASYIRPGAVVIDVGMNPVTGEAPLARPGKTVVGDVAQKSVEGLVSAMTPVPGGVGPVTVLCLFDNLVTSAEEACRSELP